MSAAALTVLMLGMFACIGGGIALYRRGERRKGALMLTMAIVLLGNVLIWTL